MTPFVYARADSLGDTIAAGAAPDSAFLAGGTELLNWLRLGIAEPTRIIDISRLDGLDQVETLPGGGLTIGALTHLNDVAQHALVVRDYPVLSQAILNAASPQLRNLATIGGNLLQKTRCAYFRAEEQLPCNKRQLGSGCSALHGINDNHAIFGWTEDCVATSHPTRPWRWQHLMRSSSPRTAAAAGAFRQRNSTCFPTRGPRQTMCCSKAN